MSVDNILIIGAKLYTTTLKIKYESYTHRLSAETEALRVKKKKPYKIIIFNNFFFFINIELTSC